jgi:hypothetical protein
MRIFVGKSRGRVMLQEDEASCKLTGTSGKALILNKYSDYHYMAILLERVAWVEQVCDVRRCSEATFGIILATDEEEKGKKERKEAGRKNISAFVQDNEIVLER